MDSLTLTATMFANASAGFQLFPARFLHAKKKSIILACPWKKSRIFFCSASKGDENLNDWDRMELKFGRMIGEDPKITLAKIMGRKLNPDMSYLEIEKLLEKRKGKALDEDMEEIPFDVSDEKKSMNSVQGLNLVRPVPKKGTKFEVTSKPTEAEAKGSKPPVTKTTKETKSSVPDVILRKPSSFYVDNDGNEKASMLRMKPNLSLKMGKEAQKGKFSDITLLKKPEPLTDNQNVGEENDHSDSLEGKDGVMDELGDKSPKYGTATVESNSATLLQRPELHNFNEEEEESSKEHTESDGNPKYGTTSAKSNSATLLLKPGPHNFNKGEGQESSKEHTVPSTSTIENGLEISPSDDQLETATGSNRNQFQETEQRYSGMDEGSATELQADKLSGGETFSAGGPYYGSTSVTSPDTVLIGKPKRLDRSSRATDQKVREEVIPVNPESLGNPSELENFLTNSPVKEQEDVDWARAEKLVKTGERAEVELISSSIRGFVASFGSLIGFLPYRNLAARWKFIAFESWLRRKGIDPSNYRQNLGIIGTYEAPSTTTSSESSGESEIGDEDGIITSDMKLEDLLMIYDQEKLKFLSSFVGQKIKVGVVLADRRTRKLIFSIKPKEKEELVEKKRSLMAQLRVGDIVKCCIKKITYFGVFVEVEGVPALIHQTEVSWDATLDPASYFKVGQIVDAKVHQLDFSLERIFLSLKEVTPDPLTETLEAVVGDLDSTGFRLEAAEPDTEWADVESLIKELQQVDGIQSVSKGRYFLSPGLAPTFQVYMASMFENQYKLLARAGNKVQEVIVETSLSKEELKSVITTCTNRVE